MSVREGPTLLLNRAQSGLSPALVTYWGYQSRIYIGIGAIALVLNLLLWQTFYLSSSVFVKVFLVFLLLKLTLLLFSSSLNWFVLT